jgi:hypothetical protein
MTFARYKGGGGEGQFTKGKTYIVKPAGSDAVNVNDVGIWDDQLDLHTIDPDAEHRFEFCESAYGVFLKDCMGYESGDVIVVDDVSIDLTMFSIETPEGARMIQAHLIELVDWRTLKPGVELLDLETRCWERVERVDESMWVQVDGCDELRSLVNYRFAVTDGEVDRVRTARCINAAGLTTLVEGNSYRVCREGNGTVLVETDDGQQTFDIARFEFV